MFFNTFNMEANEEPLLNAHIWSEQLGSSEMFWRGQIVWGRAKLSKEADSFDATPYA